MSNKIQIKRSQTNTTVPALANGELAYTANGAGAAAANQGLLYIGGPDGAANIPIGGKFNFGLLTACAAIVTNATAYTDKLLTANLTAANAFLTVIYANGAVGTDAKVLQSNASGGIYWGSGATAGVSSVGSANGIIGGPITSTGTLYVNTGTNGGLLANVTGLWVVTGGSILTNATGVHVNAAATSGLVANATGLWVQAANGLTVNATGFIAVNSSGSIAVNSTGTFANAGGSIVANATGIHVNAASTSGLVANATGLWAKSGNGITVDAGGINVNVAATSGLLANATGVWVLVGNGHTVNATGYIAVNSSGSIAVNSTGVFANAGGSMVANITGIHVNAASTSGLVANATGLWAKAGNGIAVDAGGINVLAPASSGLVSNATGTWLAVNSSQFVLTSGGLTCNSTGNITLQDLYLGGNLLVSGALVTINTSTLAVNDNLIALAYNQAGTTTFNDLCDSGFYITTGNTGTPYFSGLARIKNSSTNTNPYFQIFSYTGTAPNSTVLPAVTTGTLQSFLAPWGAGGALVVNGTNISVTANGSVAVAVTANTLSLATRLAVSNVASGSDGDVLQSNSTASFWGTLDGGTF